MSKRKFAEKRHSHGDSKKQNNEIDSEEDLPSILPITKKNGFSKGEVVFVKFKKHPYWPAVFCKNAFRAKGTSLHAYVHFFEVATENSKKLIKVPIKNIKYFSCSDREEIITVGSLLDDFKFGMDQAEEYLRKRALGKIPSFFDQTDTDKFLEDVNDSIINRKNKKEKTISVKRVAVNTELMKSIKLTRVTLRNIAVGMESSIRHDTFTKGSRRDKANLKWKAGYGPLNDNESDEVLETLLNWFKEDFDDLPYNPISYVSDVWLPEAIIRGIAMVNNLNLKDAEELSETTIMKNEEIQCLVISFDDKLSSAFNVIKSLLVEEDIGCSNDNVSYYVWKFNNKYFSSDVKICCTVHQSHSLEKEKLKFVEGVIFVLNASEPGQIEKLKEFFSQFVIAPEISLVYENGKTSEDLLEQSKFFDWCVENHLELVLSLDSGNQDSNDNNFKEKFGVDRIIEALSSHVWKNHVMKQEAKPQSSTGQDEDVLEKIMNGESFEEMFSKFRHMKEAAMALQGNDRKDLAEKIALAFMEAFDLEESDENEA